ncbi:MAG: carboxypeptidase-like regulatory domain-containing protein, partial [Bacteroidales bacterium]|nr:carboxypeptidase-like regulatory domain-containing protein [Bacteroidales bacterium]
MKGRVVNSNTNSPVADVIIFIEGTDINTTSDTDGAYEIILPLDEDFQLRASRIGYKALSKHIDTSQDSLIYVELKLVEDPKEIGQV